MKIHLPLRLSLGIRRILLVAGILTLMVFFHLVYVSWLNPVYGFLGFSYPKYLGLPTFVGYVLGVIPGFWMPMSLNRPSQFLHWMLYLTTFVPSMLVLSFLQLRPSSEVLDLQLMLFLGLTLIGLSYRFRIRPLPKFAMPSSVIWALLAVGTIALMVRVLTVYWGNFHFVAWDKTYESIRFTGSDLATAAGLSYPITWLAIVFFPTLSALALLRRKPWLFAIALVGDLLLYMTQGMKHILFAGFYILIVFALLRRRSELFGLKITWATALFFIIFYVYVHVFDLGLSVLAMLLGANIVMRVFGTPALLLGVYQNFLVDHPLTFYSHVTGINMLVHYPYQRPLGLEVGMATSGFSDYNMNAGFWVTDGLASCGLSGIMVISVLVAIVFYWLDRVSLSQRAGAVALCLSQYAIYLMNVSFFTSIVTGGLFIFFGLFYLMPAGFCGNTGRVSPPVRLTKPGRPHGGALQSPRTSRLLERN